MSEELQASIIFSHWNCLTAPLKCHNADGKTNGVGFTNLAVSSLTVVWTFTSYCLNPQTLSLLMTSASMWVLSKRSVTSPPCSWPRHPVIRRLSQGVLGTSRSVLPSISWTAFACASSQPRLEWLLFPQKQTRGRDSCLLLLGHQRANIYQIPARHRTMQGHVGHQGGSDVTLPLRCSSL